jgi:hypothetical protein
LAAQQGQIDKNAVDVPLRHPDDEATTTDLGRMLAGVGVVEPRGLSAAFVLERAVAYEI